MEGLVDKPFRTVACVGNLQMFTAWLTDALGDEDRAIELCRTLKADGLAWAFVGSPRGPLELVLCDERRALLAMLHADVTVALIEQPFSFAFVAGALDAPLCLPEDDSALPINSIWDADVDPLNSESPVRFRIDSRTATPEGVSVTGTVLCGTLSPGLSLHLPGVGEWRIDDVSAEGTPRTVAGPGEVVELGFTGISDPGELPGALLVRTPEAPVTTIRIDVPDGGGRLWWPDGWVRVRVKDGVATLRAPRVVASGQRAVLARAGQWSLITL
ncbi:MAG: hypothetical protein ACJAZO_005105 [Myxococcota bacterium]